ncbi:MAG: histidinol dehydrogenase [Erysipelotrichia bacterium]|nr:histidinol dehydrogenase [Erysipelotrichia bacterium]NCC54318.1 histidinol dehydrogenase [Erysipelotrichia bacterium]
MLTVIDSKNLDTLRMYLESREEDSNPEIVMAVEAIIKEVKKCKDDALYAYTKQFDQVELTSLMMSEAEIDAIYEQVDDAFIEAMQEAKANITLYHQQQLQSGYEIQKDNGVYLGQRVMPLASVGVYVPGGRAAYPSSVLMNVIPAKIAGVKEIIMVTPPNKEGSVNPYIVAAAKIAGVNKIYKVGGAQSIAALAYGTQSIPKVDKIVGPGNVYVATAKKLVYGKVDIDMIAGPSEILVIADESADPKYVAADLISQAEHDPMASSILLTTSQTLIEKVNQELSKQSNALPKVDIIKESFANYGKAMLCDCIEQCIEIANQIAPEHLELMVEDAKEYLPLVSNAGSVFLGYYTCESIGDYFGGTNHVLPTSGTARFYSPLSCDSFIKKSSYLYYSKEALKQDGEKIITIAHNENLDGHANAVKVRLADEND